LPICVLPILSLLVWKLIERQLNELNNPSERLQGVAANKCYGPGQRARENGGMACPHVKCADCTVESVEKDDPPPPRTRTGGGGKRTKK
jgi:hypothetical protein